MEELNKVFKDYYESGMKYQMNRTPIWLHQLPGDWTPPPWHKRWRNRFKNRIWDLRMKAASKLAGHDVLDRDW